MKRGALLIVLCLVALPSCARKEDPSAWISGAEAAHEEADRLSQSGDPDRALVLLAKAAAKPAPEGTGQDDARIVRQDLFYRLATAQLESGHPKEAAEAASEGLALGHRQDLFTANLLFARGRAFETLSDPKNASRDYHEALLINEALLEGALGGAHTTP